MTRVHGFAVSEAGLERANAANAAIVAEAKRADGERQAFAPHAVSAGGKAERRTSGAAPASSKAPFGKERSLFSFVRRLFG